MSQVPIRIEEKRVIWKALNIFLMLFLFFGSLLGGIIAIYYHSQLDTAVSKMARRQSVAVDLESRSIGEEFEGVYSDILNLVGQNELKKYLNTGKSEYLEEMQSEYLVFAANKRIYDQVRFFRY